MKPSSTSSSAASSSADASGSSVRSSPIDLELDPVGLERLAGELGGQDGVAGGEAAGGVGQQLDARAVEHVDDRAALGRVDPAQRDGHQLRAGDLQRARQRVERAEAARAEQQPRAQRLAGDGQDVGASVGDGHVSPPGSRAGSPPAPPRATCVAPHCPRGTTSASTATATPRPAAGRSSDAKRGLDRRAVANSADSPFSTTFMRAPRRSGAGRRAAAKSGNDSPASTPATRSAVTGVSRMPLRKWPVAQTRPSSAPRPIAGRLSGVAGRRPAMQLLDLELEDARDELAEVAQQLVDAAGGRRACPSRAPPSSRRARSGRRRAGRSTPARRGSCAPRAQGRSGSRSRRTCPLTGRTGTRACSGMLQARATSTPAATTTWSAETVPLEPITPVTRSPSTFKACRARGDARAGELAARARRRAAAGRPSGRSRSRSASRIVGASAGSSRRACDGRRRSTGSPSPRPELGEAVERLGLVAVARDDERAHRRGSPAPPAPSQNAS